MGILVHLVRDSIHWRMHARSPLPIESGTYRAGLWATSCSVQPTGVVPALVFSLKLATSHVGQYPYWISSNSDRRNKWEPQLQMKHATTFWRATAWSNSNQRMCMDTCTATSIGLQIILITRAESRKRRRMGGLNYTASWNFHISQSKVRSGWLSKCLMRVGSRYL